MENERDLIRLARAFGEALRDNPGVQAYQQAVDEAQADPRAGQLKVRLDALYDELVQRQAAGEVLPEGEIEAYYHLEHEVEAHPALAREAEALERVRDLFSETHALLTNELGFNLQDMIK